MIRPDAPRPGGPPPGVGSLQEQPRVVGPGWLGFETTIYKKTIFVKGNGLFGLLGFLGLLRY